jgi:HD-like signal output (HDOD) protein
METQSIEASLRLAEDLDVFPEAALRIRQIVDRDDTSLTDLEQAVSLDPTLCGQIVKLANSPFFGVSREVASLRQALLVLGFDTTRDLALALAVMALCRSPRKLCHDLWQHSVRTAVAAELVARRVGRDGSEAFLCGMLHDLGKLIFLELNYEAYGRVLEKHFDHETVLVDAEKAIFSFDHAAFSGACLERWELPDRICEGVRHHHDVVKMAEGALGTAYRPAAVIHIGDAIVHALARHDVPENIADRVLREPPAGVIGLTREAVLAVAQDLDQQVAEVGLLRL